MTDTPEIALPSRASLLSRLQVLLQEMHWSRFEMMVPLLVGRMIDVRLVQARTGYQDGADAGTVGRSGRRLRIEAKRYSSSFDARDVIGGLRQAIAHDPTLECWIACATRDIPEQLASQLEAEGASEGIPVLTITWDAPDAPLLAALCTQDPEIVAEYAGDEAGRIASALTPDLTTARDYLSRELEAWQIGFERLRAVTHAELDEMWRSKRAAKARFGQDVAAGDGRSMVERVGTSRQLDQWWGGRAALDAPAVVVGQGGVGKTCAALSWIMGRLERLPIVVTIPAGAVTPATGASVESLLLLIGGRVATITGTRDAEHWSARLKRILARPSEDGPALCLLFDGVNQNDRPPWLPLLQLLQDRPFSGRVRTMVTTRLQHFEGALGRTRSLVEHAEVVRVERFDDAPGGELDTMLAAHHLTRDDLHPDLVDYARVPRLFALVIRLRDRLTDAGRVTTHRLLWEYGRDAQGERAGISFSEAEWQTWLAEVARNERDGLRTYTLATLCQTAARPDLDPSQVAARLSDIIDGNLTVPGPGGTLQLAPEIVAHALGAALLEQLDDAARHGKSVEGELAEWLDPIDGWEERAEVLRAAASIMAERDTSAAPAVAAAVVTSWLQTQNLPSLHLVEIHRLAPRQVQPLLETIERSGTGPQASARALAVDALRSTTIDTVGYGLIVATIVKWYSRVSRDVNWRGEGFEQAEAARSNRILARIGTDAPGPLTVAGYDIELQDHPDDGLLSAAVTVLDGHPLVGATEVFARAALAMAIKGWQGVWEDLKWLCLLNEVDPVETAARLRSLSAEIAQRPAESGIHPELPQRVAALLLWLTGQEGDDDAAYAIDPGIDRQLTYVDDYLANPGTSWFRLERRHAGAVLEDRTIPLLRRVDRAADFLIDPSFEVPQSLADELAAAADEFDVTKLDVGRYSSEEDRALEQIEVALARCVPDRLASLHRRKLAGYLDRPTTSFDSSAWSAAEAILLADEAARAGCRALRERSMAAGGGMNESSASSLLIIEILDLPGVQQITSVLDMGPSYISTDFAKILRPLSSNDVDALLEANADADSARLKNLVGLLSATSLAGLSDRAWEWLERRALDATSDVRPYAFETLYRCDARRFGEALFREGWSWERDEQDLCRYYGSLAIAEAGLSLPFEEIAPRIAPALLARVVHERGGAPAEAHLAAEILDKAIMQPALQSPEPGSTLTVNSERRRDYPMAISITPGPMPDEEGDPFSALRRTPEEHRDHFQRAVDTALERIRQVRSEGGSLYLSSIDARDLHPIVRAAPSLLDRWLEGASERSRDFRRRVHLAEGFYLALCEALLATSPSVGSVLWRALRESMATRYKGRGGVDERVLMLFRVPPTREVLDLRASLLDLAAADTDERLLDLTVAAIANGGEAWLSNAVEKDAKSNLSWRRRRAVMLTGFQTGADLPVESATLEGEHHSAAEERQAAAGRRLARDAAARHWWRRFVEAEDEVAAFAAWTLFRRAADRRALAWLWCEVCPDRNADPLSWRKYQQFVLNNDDLVKKAEKREKDASRRLLDRSISRNVRPWYRSSEPQ